MTPKAQILSRLEGRSDGSPFFLPDLTLWYRWHREKGTLPERWRSSSLAEIARSLGYPAWSVVQPWRVETRGAGIRTEQEEHERTVRYETASGVLTARWTLGPDGAWWQTEYPVKTAQDLAAVLDLVRSRVYVPDPSELISMGKAVGEDGVVAMEIPSTPYTELMQEYLGWSEGLMLLMDEPPEIPEILEVLQDRLENLLREVARMPGPVALSPDNLDGQFLSPTVFQEHLAESYRRASAALSPAGKRLIVHAGGPIRRLLKPLAEAGVTGVQGVAGPPQGDTSLAQAREIAGPGIALWGGIPHEYLMATHDFATFEAAVRQAAREASGDLRAILGAADRVPVEADPGRLEAIPAILEGATR